MLLKIRASTGTAKVVTLRDYQAAKTSDGSYDTGTRLFETALRAADAVVQPLPLPVMSLMRPTYAFWFMDATPPGGLPRSFIIRGQPWWYAGEAGGQPVYRGFYDGQQMSLGTADANGQRLVTLTDYQFDENGNLLPGTTETTQGTLSGLRGSIRFRDGTIALSGTDAGTQQTITFSDDYSLHTIRSDVDILGNTLSFGILGENASLAGALFHFYDRQQGAVRLAGLRSIISRANAEWTWEKADSENAAPEKLLHLDKDHQLKLYPKTGGNGTSGILLNPSGLSIFEGGILVPESGDISMGSFKAGPAPAAP